MYTNYGVDSLSPKHISEVGGSANGKSYSFRSYCECISLGLTLMLLGTTATCVRGSGRAERPAGMRGRKARSAEAVPSRSGPPPKRSSTDALRPIRRSSVAAVLCRSGHLPKRRLAEARSRPTGLGRRPNDGNSFACVFANFRVEAERQPAVETKNATASLIAPCDVPTDTYSNQALHT